MRGTAARGVPGAGVPVEEAVAAGVVERGLPGALFGVLGLPGVCGLVGRTGAVGRCAAEWDTARCTTGVGSPTAGTDACVPAAAEGRGAGAPLGLVGPAPVMEGLPAMVRPPGAGGRGELLRTVAR